MSNAIALKPLNKRLAGTRQGFASPRKTAPLTEPRQPLEETLYEGDGEETMAVCQSKRLTFGWTNFGGTSETSFMLRAPASPPSRLW